MRDFPPNNHTASRLGLLSDFYKVRSHTFHVVLEFESSPRCPKSRSTDCRAVLLYSVLAVDTNNLCQPHSNLSLTTTATHSLQLADYNRFDEFSITAYSADNPHIRKTIHLPARNVNSNPHLRGPQPPSPDAFPLTHHRTPSTRSTPSKRPII